MLIGQETRRLARLGRATLAQLFLESKFAQKRWFPLRALGYPHEIKKPKINK